VAVSHFLIFGKRILRIDKFIYCEYERESMKVFYFSILKNRSDFDDFFLQCLFLIEIRNIWGGGGHIDISIV
jgi:hypothetical protein